MTTATATDLVHDTHPWERAGLGLAPFRLRCIQEIPPPSLAEANVDAYNNALRSLDGSFHPGTCGVCGMALMLNFGIESADGQRFSVGCDCVLKRGGSPNLVSRVEKAKRDHERAKRRARAQAKRRGRAQAKRRGRAQAKRRGRAQAKREAAWEARRAARQAREDEEWERNGGSTDAELAAQEREQDRQDRVAALTPLALRLQDGHSGFRDNVARSMLEEGRLPRGRGLEIMVDILARQAGRSGTREYMVEADRVGDFVADFERSLGGAR